MSATGRRVRLGQREVNFPSDYVQQLEDSNHLLNNPEGLKDALQEKGYLFIRGLHDRYEVLAARRSVLDYVDINATTRLVSPSSGLLDARCGRGCIPFMEGKNAITHSKEVLTVLEGPRPKQLFRRLFNEKEVRTFDFKWLRGINRKQYTGAHVDNVYMGRGTSNLYTMWTPFGDTTVEMGTLAVCEGSNRLPGFKRFQETYGELDIEKENVEGTGWFTEDPFEITTKFGGQWKTSDFKAGDVLIFTMRTVHMSTSNITDYLRISSDTRWQPEDEVADPRYVGDIGVTKPKYGLFGKETERKKQMIDDLKEQWQL